MKHLKSLLIISSIFSVLGCTNPNNMGKESENVVENNQESVKQVEITDIPTAEELQNAKNDDKKATVVAAAFSGEKVWKTSIPTGAGKSTDICLKIIDSAQKTM